MRTRTSKVIAAAGLIVACAQGASAAIYSYDIAGPVPGANNAGGTFDAINAKFNSGTERFVWRTTFSDQVTEGFWLVVNNGPNPKGHAGELGILYFDGSNPAAPKLTAYAYNGQNGPNSWKDGDGVAAGNQTPDLIHGTADTSWINRLKVIDDNGKRTFVLNIDAGDIINHNVMYPDAVDPWYGVGFDNSLGLWFHPTKNFEATYGGVDGAITNLNIGTQGWIDNSFQTTTVPTPGAAVLGGLGGLALLRRRKAN